MVRVLNRDELRLEKGLIENLKGSVFIFPTDTLYGIGCDATNEELVRRVRRIKKRAGHPFTIIVPDESWISSYCKVAFGDKKWLAKLPGAYTLIFDVKKRFFADSVNPIDDSIGIRLPNHWFIEIVKKMNVPVVITSVNVSGEDFMTSIDDLNPEIKSKVDFIISDGRLKGRPSTIVHLEKSFAKVKI